MGFLIEDPVFLNSYGWQGKSVTGSPFRTNICNKSQFRKNNHKNQNIHLPGLLDVVVPVEAPLLTISSSFIRDGIRAGREMRYFLPDKVCTYIREMNFYK